MCQRDSGFWVDDSHLLAADQQHDGIRECRGVAGRDRNGRCFLECVRSYEDRLMCTLAQRAVGRQQVGLESILKSPQVRSQTGTARAQPVLHDADGKSGGNLHQAFGLLLPSILEPPTAENRHAF